MLPVTIIKIKINKNACIYNTGILTWGPGKYYTVDWFVKKRDGLPNPSQSQVDGRQMYNKTEMWMIKLRRHIIIHCTNADVIRSWSYQLWGHVTHCTLFISVDIHVKLDWLKCRNKKQELSWIHCVRVGEILDIEIEIVLIVS